MMELSDALAQAEASTSAALPGFDEAVLVRTVTSRVRRTRGLRAFRVGVLAAVALAAVGSGTFLVASTMRQHTPVAPVPAPSGSGTVSPTPGPNPSATDGSSRPVTVADGLPSANPATAAIVSSAGTGWVLAVFDSSFRPVDGEPTAGERVLYLVSPTGDRYEVANLSDYSAPRLEAWDTNRNVAFIVENRYVSLTVDLSTGDVTHEWQFCGEGGSLRAAPTGDGHWLLRGSCSGTPLDGVYNDDGTPVASPGIVDGGEGVTVMDVGDVQVRYEFEKPPAESYVAYMPDGSHVALAAVSPETACYPLGPSLLGGLAVQCWGSGDAVSIWNLPLDGGDATPIAVPETLRAIDAAAGGALPPDGAILTGYCLAGRHEAIVTSHPAVAVLGEDSPTVMVDGEYRATSCLGGEGDTTLLAGAGPLWTWNAATGAIVTMLPVPEPGDGGVWVGASENGAIIHP